MLTREQALQKLQHQVDQIDSLVASPRNLPHLTGWQLDTQTVIERTFGPDTRHIKGFNGVPYIHKGPEAQFSPEEHQRFYRLGLERARAVLTSYMNEIAQYGVALSQGKAAPYLPIFISHAHADQEVARLLVGLLVAVLPLRPESIRCTSLNGYRLPAGSSFAEQLRQEVHDTAVLIALITPHSVKSTFVLFELGARWGAGGETFTLLSSGAEESLLPATLANVNALHCGEVGQLLQSVGDVAGKLGAQLNRPEAYSDQVTKLARKSNAEARKLVTPGT